MNWREDIGSAHECSGCGSEADTRVRVQLVQLATHADGERQVQGRADACCSDLEAICTACDAVRWQTDATSRAEPDVDAWEQGTACPSCGSQTILETVVEWRVHSSTGDVVEYGDRTHTVKFTCEACASILDSTDIRDILTGSDDESGPTHHTLDAY